MALINHKPTSPGRRDAVSVRTEGLYKGAPYAALTESQSKTGGRNHHGRITVRHRGGGHKQQYRIIGSFGASIRNIAESLDKMAAGMKPVIDTEVPIENVADALKRMESRQVFGKIIVTL